jgi:outer membrane protein TolC
MESDVMNPSCFLRPGLVAGLWLGASLCGLGPGARVQAAGTAAVAVAETADSAPARTARASRPAARMATPRSAAVVPGGAPATESLPSLPVRCIDEDRAADGEPRPGASASASELAAQAGATAEPRQLLLQMVQDALARSHAVGASRLLADAARADQEQAEASRKPQASLVASVAPALIHTSSSSGAQLQAQVGVQFSQVLYDGGRIDRTVDWRQQQAESARLGMLTVQEQLTLAVTSLALERSRYRMQAVIYGHNVRKMACLVQALEGITTLDKGRMSELVQARKQQQQAELSQAQAVSQSRQVEARLRRLVGDGLPGTEGFASLLMAVPELPELLAGAERTSDIAALDAGAAAARELARLNETANRPQLSWNVGTSAALVRGTGAAHSGGLSAGVQLSIPLLSPTTDPGIRAARQRAEAATLQRADALESKRQRLVDTWEQSSHAFDRVRRVSGVLRDSERLRNYTLQQWQQLGRRSLFDVLSAESEHYNLRVQYVNALHDGQQMNATLLSLGSGLANWLQ